VLPALLTGCEEEPARTALNYTSNAKKAFDDAMTEFNGHNWVEAQNLFREFKKKYSSARKYVLLAELRIADADFEQEKYTDAIREYRQFVHDHQGQNITEETAYARSRIADSEYKEIGDSFFLAAGEERDQASVLDAYKELRSFIHDYPASKETDRMRKLLTDVTGRLIRHELYVARFYLGKSNYEACIARVEYAPYDGSTPSQYEKIRMSTIPSRNPGIECPSIAAEITLKSTRPCCRVAASTPAAVASSVDSRIAGTCSLSVSSPHSCRRSATG